ncbi:hypothetical protein RR46_08709 [Papilio xuthus]|uniref:Uncharacterized protein n=1 Tax=Papilio xuthus TaxID=66420 RepID=A0A194Q803_PAPXU|nr:hypothetical protein RR46_08709 [Papilio xuthus]
MTRIYVMYMGRGSGGAGAEAAAAESYACSCQQSQIITLNPLILMRSLAGSALGAQAGRGGDRAD